MYAHGQEIGLPVTPLLEAYFTFQKDEEAFAEADAATRTSLSR